MYILYRIDRSLFNPRRLQAQTKTFEQLYRDSLFATDPVLVGHTGGALQLLAFSEASQLFGLEIILKMTEVLHQIAHREEYRLPYINIGVTELKAIYLPGVYHHIRC